MSTENVASDPRPYPAVGNGRIGPLVDNQHLKLKLISHDSPVIQCPETGEVELEFESSVMCESLSSLELYSKDGNVKMENFCFTTHDDKKNQIQCAFSRTRNICIQHICQGDRLN